MSRNISRWKFIRACSRKHRSSASYNHRVTPAVPEAPHEPQQRENASIEGEGRRSLPAVDAALISSRVPLSFSFLEA